MKIFRFGLTLFLLIASQVLLEPIFAISFQNKPISKTRLLERTKRHIKIRRLKRMIKRKKKKFKKCLGPKCQKKKRRKRVVSYKVQSKKKQKRKAIIRPIASSRNAVALSNLNETKHITCNILPSNASYKDYVTFAREKFGIHRGSFASDHSWLMTGLMGVDVLNSLPVKGVLFVLRCIPDEKFFDPYFIHALRNIPSTGLLSIAGQLKSSMPINLISGTNETTTTFAGYSLIDINEQKFNALSPNVKLVNAFISAAHLKLRHTQKVLGTNIFASFVTNMCMQFAGSRIIANYVVNPENSVRFFICNFLASSALHLGSTEVIRSILGSKNILKLEQDALKLAVVEIEKLPHGHEIWQEYEVWASERDKQLRQEMAKAQRQEE